MRPLTIFSILIFMLQLASAQSPHRELFEVRPQIGGDRLGSSVSGVGDVNGDGVPDVIVGAYHDDQMGVESGAVYVYSGVDGSTLLTLHGNGPADHFGVAVSGIGDVNGDGHHDIVVGADEADIAGSASGNATVFSGATGQVLFSWNGAASGAAFGASVSGAGDVNADGVPDIIIGAYGAAAGGAAYVYSGVDGTMLFQFSAPPQIVAFGHSVSNAGDVNNDGYADVVVGGHNPLSAAIGAPGKAIVYSGFDGSILHSLIGIDQGDQFGVSVSGAGDVNNDGFDDIIVGANAADNNGTDSGNAKVFSGSDGMVLYSFDGDDVGDNFGAAVASAGDMDNDGFDDIVIGALSDDNNGTSSGSIRVHSGQDGSILYAFSGGAAGDWYGFSISSAGDLNADGHDDLIVGAPLSDSLGSEGGSAEVISGHNGSILHQFLGSGLDAHFGASSKNAGFVDNDQKEDLIVGSRNGNEVQVLSNDGTILFRFFGSKVTDKFGSAVSGAGDVNNDGQDDLIVGAPLNDDSGIDSGSATVFSGQDGSILYVFNGAAAGDRFGQSVSGAGDVNNDGFDDLIVGSPGSDVGGTDSGVARIFSGVDGTLIHSISGLNTSDQFGHSVVGMGDLDDDGNSDIAVGAILADVTETDCGSVRVFSGVNGATLFTLSGESSYDNFGVTIANVGDIDGDGKADLGVGANLDDKAGIDSGSVRVHSGATGGLLYTCFGDAAGDQFGFSVSGGHDLDKDGIPDLIVGAPFDDNKATDCGSARVISGANGHRILTVDGTAPGEQCGTSVTILGCDTTLTNEDCGRFAVGIPEAVEQNFKDGVLLTFEIFSHRWESPPFFVSPNPALTNNPRYGESVSNAGDTDADGVPDVIVGSPLERFSENGVIAWGKARIYSGSTGKLLHTLAPAISQSRFGTDVCAVGDINGDGSDDVAISAPFAPPIAPSGYGAIYVYSGADGSVLQVLRGLGTPSDPTLHSGSQVSGAGDINGDGTPDIIVGDSGETLGSAISGRAWVFSGANGAVLHSLVGPGGTDNFGCSVDGVGDLNNDGFDDFIVGARRDSTSNALGGSATVYSGADGTVLLSIVGSPGEHLGQFVRGTGDKNADGCPDLLVAAHFSVNVYSGVDGTLLYSFAPDSSDPRVDDAGDTNGDGVTDIVVGCPKSAASGEASGNVQIRSGINGAILYSENGNAPFEYLGVSVSGVDDIDANGLDDVLVGAVYFYHANPMPGFAKVILSQRPDVFQYTNGVATQQLTLSWNPLGGDPLAVHGGIYCANGSSGGLGIYGVSIAPTSFSIFGITILIANDPASLIESGNIGFSSTGDFSGTNISRQFPSLAGQFVFIQFFQTHPDIRASNGLAMKLVR